VVAASTLLRMRCTDKDDSFRSLGLHYGDAVVRPRVLDGLPAEVHRIPPSSSGAVRACFAGWGRSDQTSCALRVVALRVGARDQRVSVAGSAAGTDTGVDARRNPQNITEMPTSSATEDGARSPRAANADPQPAMIVAPNTMSNVQMKRSFSSGRPRIRHADHSAPTTRIRYDGIEISCGSWCAGVRGPKTSLPRGTWCARTYGACT